MSTRNEVGEVMEATGLTKQDFEDMVRGSKQLRYYSEMIEVLEWYARVDNHVAETDYGKKAARLLEKMEIGE